MQMSFRLSYPEPWRGFPVMGSPSVPQLEFSQLDGLSWGLETWCIVQGLAWCLENLAHVLVVVGDALVARQGVKDLVPHGCV